jgi:hypothetical protein
VPFQLPPSVSHFTGRTGELRELTALLDRPGRRATETVVISGYEQARAHRGLASAYQAAGDSELARRHTGGRPASEGSKP